MFINLAKDLGIIDDDEEFSDDESDLWATHQYEHSHLDNFFNDTFSEKVLNYCFRINNFSKDFLAV